jgi:AcrR family transcriptional regulator
MVSFLSDPTTVPSGHDDPDPDPAPPALAARRGYHHGHLHDALIRAARVLLAERGPQGFTLADAARMAGVTPAAPYRHFRDREALLKAVAAQGFRDFTARLAAALGSERPAPERLQAMGEAYLAFAREEPGAYAAMFVAPHGPADAERPMSPEASAAFETLLAGLRPLVPASPGGNEERLQVLATQIWALSHGVATLEGSGRLCARTGVDPLVVLLEGTQALLKTSRAP